MNARYENTCETILLNRIIEELGRIKRRGDAFQDQVKVPDRADSLNSTMSMGERLSNWESPNPLFNSLWYLANNEDVRISGVNPLIHYLSSGWKEGRSPHPLFDVEWYLSTYKEVAELGAEPLTHYLSRGWKEGKDPNSQFSTNQYIVRHSLDQNTNPLIHYIQHEWNENA